MRGKGYGLVRALWKLYPSGFFIGGGAGEQAPIPVIVLKVRDGEMSDGDGPDSRGTLHFNRRIQLDNEEVRS
ncbi:MAG: hypothetical protein A3K66_01130 [Euryarchaeota archaeon RBG_16_67_27]|nr:MAG: hypothetical protein A3K66_01130 [Euryarchaeota archaeon RBG_16_67_27]